MIKGLPLLWQWVGLFASIAGVQSSCASVAQTSAMPDLLPIGHVLLKEALAKEASGMADRARTGRPISKIDVTFPLPMCAFPGGLCGAVDRDGRVAIRPEFDWMGSFHEERALVRSRGLFGYVDTAGRVVAAPTFEHAGAFQNGYAQVIENGKMGLIDRDGRFAVPPVHAYVERQTDGTFLVATERQLRTTSETTPDGGISVISWELTLMLLSDGSIELRSTETLGRRFLLLGASVAWPPTAAHSKIPRRRNLPSRRTAGSRWQPDGA